MPPEQGAAAAAAADVPSLPMEQDYENDVSRVFISLNNHDQAPSASGVVDKEEQAEAKERRRSARYKEEEQRSTLAEYFSSLFDESFCSHNFKLVG